jgi:hypothetical protein
LSKIKTAWFHQAFEPNSPCFHNNSAFWTVSFYHSLLCSQTARTVVRRLVLHGGAIYGVNTPIREVKFHAGGIYIERTAYELFHGYILLNLMLFYPETKLQYP